MTLSTPPFSPSSISTVLLLIAFSHATSLSGCDRSGPTGTTGSVVQEPLTTPKPKDTPKELAWNTAHPAPTPSATSDTAPSNAPSGATSDSGKGEVDMTAKAVDCARTVLDLDRAHATLHGVGVGATKREVVARGFTLAPEGINRADRVGMVCGPVLFQFDARDTVAVVSLDLKKSAGVRIDGTRIAAGSDLNAIARALPSAKKSAGSGGGVLDCSLPQSPAQVSFYDNAGAPTEVTLVISRR